MQEVRSPVAKQRLTGLRVSKVSLVKRAAVRDPDAPDQPMRFLVTKAAEDEFLWSVEVPIVKADAARRLVYGVALAPDQADSQGDVISPEDVEATAHQFLLDWITRQQDWEGGPMNLQHGPDVDAVPVESYIAPADMTWDAPSGERSVKKGSWVMTSYIAGDETWRMVESGQITGLSIEGYARREQKQEESNPMHVVKEAGPMSAIDAEVAELREQVPDWTGAGAVRQVLRERPELYRAYKAAAEVEILKADTVVQVARQEALRELEALTAAYLSKNRAAPGKPAPSKAQAFAAILDTPAGRKWWAIYAGK